jgi:succinate dehydrogenase / fumarate reductase, flavoprotein subunit
MVLVSECVARAALLRTESRGGHTRDDHPQMDPVWRNKLLVCRAVDDGDPVVPAISVTGQPQQPMRSELLELFELAELEKYYTEDELASHPGKKS